MSLGYYIVRLSEKPYRIRGPLSVQSVFRDLQAGLLSWTDIGYRAGSDKPWRRLFEINSLRILMDKVPSVEEMETLNRDALRKTDELRSGRTRAASTKKKAKPVKPMSGMVYLQIRGSEHGPMMPSEIRRAMQTMHSKDQVYIWYHGLRNWIPIQQLPEFAHLEFPHSQMEPLNDGTLMNTVFTRESRYANRHGLVATVRLLGSALRRDVFGICLDVSLTGMQMRLEEHVDFQVSREFEFEMIPLSILKLSTIRFRAKVIWVKPEEMRVGLHFTYFEADGKDRLQDYLSRAQAELLRSG